MRLLIDGYNLMFESTSVDLAKDGKNALRAARGRMLQMLVELIDESIRDKTMIVFDAKKAPPNLPDKYEYYGIKIVLARNWDSADELIQLEIRRHSTPKNLTVVSSDHAIHRKAVARGAKVIDSMDWLDQRLSARSHPERDAHLNSEIIEEQELESKNREMSDEEKKNWLKEFGG